MQVAKQEGHPAVLAVLKRANAKFRKQQKLTGVEEAITEKQLASSVARLTNNNPSSQPATQTAVSTSAVAGEKKVITGTASESSEPSPKTAAVKQAQANPGLQKSAGIAGSQSTLKNESSVTTLATA